MMTEPAYVFGTDAPHDIHEHRFFLVIVAGHHHHDAVERFAIRSRLEVDVDVIAVVAHAYDALPAHAVQLLGRRRGHILDLRLLLIGIHVVHLDAYQAQPR